MKQSRLRFVPVAFAIVSAILLMLPAVAMPHPVTAQSAARVDVQVVDFAFEPATLTINVGTAVTWTNTGERPHTVTGTDGSFDSGRLDPGDQFTHTFDKTGAFDYFCGFHPEMKATVVVEGGGASPPPEAAATDSGQPATLNAETAVIESLLATDQQVGLAAALHAGDCAQIGNEVAAFAPALVTTGARVGTARSLPGANSFSVISVAIDAMLASDHAVVVTGPDGEARTCGEIGGFLSDAGALIVGLRPHRAFDLAGIVYLSPADTPAQTNVSLFLTGDSLATNAAQPVEASITVQDEIPADSGDAIEQAAETEVSVAATDTPALTPTPVPIGTSTDSPAPIGTTLKLDELAITVDSAYFDYGFAGAIPRGGYKVLIAQVTFRNDGDGNARYDAANFSGIDANTGVGYDPVTLENEGVLLRDGELQPGEYVSGTILIEVQDTATNVIVKYDPNMFTTDDLYWS